MKELWSDLSVLLTRRTFGTPWPPEATRAFLSAFPHGMYPDTGNFLLHHEQIVFEIHLPLFLVSWFVPPVRSKPRKHYCWTRLLALFQTKYTKLLLFQHVYYSGGFLRYLGSDLFLRIDSLLFILGLLWEILL